MTEARGIADEAARLFEAFESWARVGVDHVANGSAECQLCPFCQVLSIVRGGQPEVFDHLVDASASLMSAFRAALAAQQRQWPRPRAPNFERIDIG